MSFLMYELFRRMLISKYSGFSKYFSIIYSNLILLLLKNILSMILFILKLRYFRGPEYDLSCWMFYAHFKRMHNLLFWNVLFYSKLYGGVVQVLYIFTDFFFCLPVSSINYWECITEKKIDSSIIVKIFSISLIIFLFLRFISSAINISTLVSFWLVFTWYISCHLFNVTLFISLYLKHIRNGRNKHWQRCNKREP